MFAMLRHLDNPLKRNIVFQKLNFENLTLQLQMGFSHPSQPDIQSVWHGQPRIILFYSVDFAIKKFLTVDTNVIIAMTFSVAIVIIASRQAFEEKLSAIILTFNRNIEVS